MYNEALNCPECEPVDRRDFMRVVGTGTAVLIAGGSLTPVLSAAQPGATPAAPAAKQPRPAEALVRELWGTLTEAQKGQILQPWNHANRARTFNAAMGARIGQVYRQPQQELIERIMRAISNGEDGYTRLSRNGGWDTNGGFTACGANFFGDVADNQRWAFVFSGHHLTARCDGDSEPDYAFGGPIYYGHSPDGHSARNVFNFQTRAVQSVYDTLSEEQRRRAIMQNSPGDGLRTVTFRRNGYAGIPAGDLTEDQRRLVETTMRDLLSPYRREDADEVMALIRRNGGFERLHLGFFRDAGAAAGTRWSYWRIEGPGFVWNYRVLPHVHCYVNIARAPQA
jgi:hypothetical protein